jgi:hypothetical protein
MLRASACHGVSRVVTFRKSRPALTGHRASDIGKWVTAVLRCTGEVVKTEVRKGTSAKTGNAYSFRTARVLSGRAEFEDLTLGDDIPDLRDGDHVDLAVEVQQGGRTRVVGAWSDVVKEAVKPLGLTKSA